ncbi:unnamed protein product, partial [Brassica rapa subsp. trilocularis]
MWLLEQMIIVFTYEKNMETHLRNFDSKYLCMSDVKTIFLLVFFFFLLSSSFLNHVKWTVYCLFPRAAAEFAWLKLMHNLKIITKIKNMPQQVLFIHVVCFLSWLYLQK